MSEGSKMFFGTDGQTAPGVVLVDQTGAPYIPAGGGGGGGGGGPATIADGADITQGAKADTATTGTGITVAPFSVIALLKGIYNACVAALPAGSNIIGKVGFDQTTDGTTNKVSLATDTVAIKSADGTLASVGALADTATTGTGITVAPFSVIALLKGIYNACVGATPVGSNIIGAIIASVYYTESVAAIAANATFTGASHGLANAANATGSYAYFTGYAYADQSGTLQIFGSTDNTNFFPVSSVVNVAAGVPAMTRVAATFRYHRVVFVNGATAQGTFRCNSMYSLV